MKRINKGLIYAAALVLTLLLSGCEFLSQLPTSTEPAGTSSDCSTATNDTASPVVSDTSAPQDTATADSVDPSDKDDIGGQDGTTSGTVPDVTSEALSVSATAESVLPTATPESVLTTVTPESVLPTVTPTPTPKPTATPTPTPKPTATPTVIAPSSHAAPYCRTKLSANMQSAYDKVVTALSSPDFVNGSMTVSIDMTVENDYQTDTARLVKAVLADHPEFFFLGNSWTMNYMGTTVRSLTFTSELTNEQISSMKSSIAKGVKYYTDEISASLSDREIALRLYELLASKVAYSAEAQYKYSIAGSLINGESVCEGYAEAYQYILNMYGVQAFTVTGSATNNSNQTQNHMWVAAKLGGSWYYIDPTWANLKSNGSVIESGRTRVTYAYFALTAQQIGVSHSTDKATDFFINGLSFNSTAANYHVTQGSYFTQYDESKIKAYIQKQIPKAYNEGNEIVSLRFANASDHTAAVSYIISNVNKIYNDIPNKPSLSMSYYSNERYYVIDILLKY